MVTNSYRSLGLNVSTDRIYRWCIGDVIKFKIVKSMDEKIDFYNILDYLSLKYYFWRTVLCQFNYTSSKYLEVSCNTLKWYRHKSPSQNRYFKDRNILSQMSVPWHDLLSVDNQRKKNNTYKLRFTYFTTKL